jgi:hypothetical protein
MQRGPDAAFSAEVAMKAVRRRKTLAHLFIGFDVHGN